MHPILSIIQQQRRAHTGISYRILAAGKNARLWYYNGATWEELRPAGDVTKWWSFCKFDKQGSGAMIAGVQNGRVYHSPDWGANWAEIDPTGQEAADRNWRDGAIDGSKMVVAEMEGSVYWFGYNGAYWEQSNLETGNFNCVDLSGNQILAGEYPGRLWLTEVSTGVQEINAMGAVDRNWQAVSINGTKMAAAVYGGRPYINIDGSWNDAGMTGSFWRAIEIKSDGKALATGLYTSVYSFDDGKTWINEQPDGNATSNWFIGSRAENVMIAAKDNGRLYVNNGSVWQEAQPAGNVNYSWNCCDIIQVG